MNRGLFVQQMMVPMVCDTPVPYYPMSVSCGLPNELGDVPAEEIMLPSLMIGGLKVFAIDASGDSMEGVDIYDGDILLIEKTRHFDNFDIVLAIVDGEQLLKTYYVDDAGRHWLVPANKKYKPTELTETMTVNFLGRVKCNLRTPRDTRVNVCNCIQEYLQEKSQAVKPKRVPTREEVVAALWHVGPQIKVARHWLGPCRVLMDAGYIPEGRFDLFCELTGSVLPEHEHLPCEAELRRMAVECFAKPFEKWTDEKAPVHGTHYQKYYGAGEEMLRKLP